MNLIASSVSGNLNNSSLPDFLLSECGSQLEDGEQVLSWFQPNLSETLTFGRGFVVLTDRALLAKQPSDESKKNAVQRWPISEIRDIKKIDRAGLGYLEVLGHSQLLGAYRFTAGNGNAAGSLIAQFKQRQAGITSEHELAPSICPSCGGTMAVGQSVCANCAPSAVPDTGKSLWRLTRFARPRLTMIFLGLALTVFSSMAGMIPIALTKWLIDLPDSGNFAWVPWILAGMFFSAILCWLLSWAKTFVLASVSEHISADLRNATYSHLQRLSLEYFGGKRTGDLISRISSDTQRICDFLSINLLDFVTDIVMIIVTAVWLFMMDPMIALVGLLPFPFIAWMVSRVQRKIRMGFARGSTAWSEMVSVLADTIPGIRVVKAFAQENREIDRFRQSNDHVLEANHRVNRLWAAFSPVITLLTDMGLLVVWVYGLYRVSRGDSTVGTIAANVALIGRLYVRLDDMSRLLANAQRTAAATYRIFEILDRIPSVAEPQRPIHPGRVTGHVAMRNLTFSYGSRQVIHNVSIDVAPGEMVGLVGPSGAGKSTLVNLVCRFYDVGGGSIQVDGTDIRSFPITEYRSNIGIVLQEPFLFFGSIAENIAYGRPDATREQIISAARAAKAHDFILKLTDGYDSLVGERGQSLSGGERQRISIARALLTDPRILILDEATSAVDTETEREIQEALDILVQGRTTIAIAHRLSTLRKANRIIVLEKGRVTEVGNHDQLMRLRGTYHRLNHAQQQMNLHEE